MASQALSRAWANRSLVAAITWLSLVLWLLAGEWVLREQIYAGPLLSAILVAYLAWRAKPFGFVFWFLAMYGALFVFGALLDPVPQGIPVALAAYYYWFSVAFLLFFTLGFDLVGTVRPQAHPKGTEALASLKGSSAVRTEGFLIALYVAITVIIVVDGGGIDQLLNSRRDALIEESSPLKFAALLLLDVSLPMAFFAAMAWRQRVTPWYRILVILAVLGVASVAIFVATRTRTFSIALFLCLLLGYLYGRASRAPLVIRALVPLVVLAFIGIWLRFARGFIGEGVSGRPPLGIAELIELSIAAKGDLGYHGFGMEIFGGAAGPPGMLAGQSYWRLFLVPWPRAVVPEKPLNTERIVAQALDPANEALTLPPGIAGDLFLNFAAVGMCMGLLWGIALAVADHVRSPIVVLVGVSSAIPMYHIARGAITNPLISLALIVAGACLTIWMDTRGARVRQGAEGRRWGAKRRSRAARAWRAFWKVNP